MTRPISRVLFDGEAFMLHRRSGITRYLAELIRNFRSDPDLGVVPITPYRWVSNSYLPRDEPLRFTPLPLPARARATALSRLNRRRIVRAPEADIVHYSMYDPAALRTWRAPRRVCTVYDFTWERLPDLFPDAGSDIENKELFLRECDAILCISEATLADLRQLHPELDKPVSVTPLGVGRQFFEPSRLRPRKLPARYVLYVGNRHKHKNVDRLLVAFAELAAEDPDLHLVMTGAAPPEELGRLSELGIADRTLRLRVGDRLLPALYQNAALFAFPSLYEGFGLPMVEAMAAGCPVVAADIAALREVGAESAVFADPRDAAAIADAMRTLLGDRALAGRMVEAGRLRARDFSWTRTAESTARAYRDVMDAAPVRAREV